MVGALPAVSVQKLRPAALVRAVLDVLLTAVVEAPGGLSDEDTAFREILGGCSMGKVGKRSCGLSSIYFI